MRRLLGRFLLGEPSIPFWRYSLLAFPVALIPSVILLAVVLIGLTLAGVDLAALPRPPSVRNTMIGFFNLVMFAPLFETFLLAFVLFLLSNWIKSRLAIATISALLWGSLHGLQAPLWFFGTVWSFFVFSCAFLAWRNRSFWAAFAAAALPHALVNGTMFFIAAWVGTR